VPVTVMTMKKRKAKGREGWRDEEMEMWEMGSQQTQPDYPMKGNGAPPCLFT